MGYAESSLNCSLRVEGIESAKMLVTRGFGIAFLPYISVKEELYKKQYKIIKVPEFNMNLNITMLYKRNCPSHVSDFVDWFKNNGSKSFC
jgi:DNA-binding transcriptional LysR family regulator